MNVFTTKYGFLIKTYIIFSVFCPSLNALRKLESMNHCIQSNEDTPAVGVHHEFCELSALVCLLNHPS